MGEGSKGKGGGGGNASLEEERRVFYVAMTRARSQLTICYCACEPTGGRMDASRFLALLPASRTQRWMKLGEAAEPVRAGGGPAKGAGGGGDKRGREA